MFDLDPAIAEWRRQMAAAGLHTPAVLDELESHLRDATEHHIRSGSTPAEAFASAVRELGTAEALQAGFAEAQFPGAAQFRKVAPLAYGVELLVYTLLAVPYLLKYHPVHGELWLGIGALAATWLLAYGGRRWMPRWLGLIPNKTIRGAVAIGGNLSTLGWMAIFAWLVLPSCNFTPGQFAAVVLWAFLPMLIAPTLLLGLESPESTPAPLAWR